MNFIRIKSDKKLRARVASVTEPRGGDARAETSPEMRFPPPEPFDVWLVPPEKSARRVRSAVAAEPAKPVAPETIAAAQKALDALDAVAVESRRADDAPVNSVPESSAFEEPALAEPPASFDTPTAAVVDARPTVADPRPDEPAHEFAVLPPPPPAADPPTADAPMVRREATIALQDLVSEPPEVERPFFAASPAPSNHATLVSAQVHEVVADPLPVERALDPTAPRVTAAVVAEPAPRARGFALVPMDSAPVDEWAALAKRDSADNVFFDPSFMLPLLRHLGGATALATVRNGEGALIAAAPLAPMRLGRVAPAYRLFGNPYAPVGAPLVDGDALDAGISGLVEGLAACGRSLVVPDLSLNGPIAETLRAVARRTGRPVVVVGEHLRGMLIRPAAGSSSPREALSAKRRNEYRRQMLRLADQGVVAIESVTDEAAVRAAFEEFLDLEASGWKGRAGSALLSRKATAEFARASVAALSATGRARVDTIRLVGKPIAMLVSFVAGATAYTWKIAYDESHARFSPGAQLMLEAGRSIFAGTAVEHIDSCAVADHPMVDHVWRDRVAIGTLVIGPPGGGALHAAGCAAARAEIGARSALRKLRRRRG